MIRGPESFKYVWTSAKLKNEASQTSTEIYRYTTKMKCLAAWRFLFMLLILGWLFIWVMLPTKAYKDAWTPKLKQSLNSTYFREHGTNLLLLTLPVMLIAALGCVYLHFAEKSEIASYPESRAKKSHGCQLFSRKRPVLVVAPLGIVNIVELAFSAMFIVLLIWSLANYLHTSFGHLHMDKPGTKVWKLKFRSVSLRLGYIGNICWAFLFFPVTRWSSILPLVGLSSESSIKYHIWLGHISMILFAAHSIGFIVYWGMTDQMAQILEWSKTYVPNVAGLIAFLFSLPIWATSLYPIRRKMFEVFFDTHHLYILYIFFYILHVGVAYFCMILPGIFLFLIDRYIRFLQSKRRTRLISARLLPCGTTELTFSKNPGLRYNPTSTLFLNVPSISKLQWHPFTIISNSNLEPDKLSIAIKSQGSWSQKLYKQLSSNLDHLQVSTEGPYGPTSFHLLRHDAVVMISGGSGITPFISIIREIIYRSTKPNCKVPKVLLVAAFKNAADLSKLDLLLPGSITSIDVSQIQLEIEAYITGDKEHSIPTEESDNPYKPSQITTTTRWFKPSPSDLPISAVLGQNSWLWLGAIISTSFIMFLLFLGILTRYAIYPTEKRGELYHYSLKTLWDMFFVCACVFLATSVIFLFQKRTSSAPEVTQIQNLELPIPTTSPAGPLSCGVGGDDRELESLPCQPFVEATRVHFGSRPDLKRILFDIKGWDVGVVACGPRKMRHEVAKICSSGPPKNLHFESVSFTW
ncbi:hypothetical protein ACH5RR_019705 [Cinchona calisaya]|uniref:FAD-binding FR-type domain-containing protein n=1 Tax=Cinchona calisaya TaxID=153742 RepID=A0ABD2ZQ45_9GENT